MTNEEKLKYLQETQAFTMRHRIWDKPGLRFDELKTLDDESWEEFSKYLLPSIPKVLYRYRPVNDFSLDELFNDYAWFSNPVDFDDGTDSALNTDIESEMKGIDEHPEQMLVALTRAVILQQFRLKTGRDPDDKLIESGIKLWPDGKLDTEAMKCALSQTCPNVKPEPYVNMLAHFNESGAMNKVEKPLKEMLDYYMDINKKIRSDLLCLCLAEEYDNDVMWAKYAGERSGFCIGYEMADESFLGQRALMALSPVFYGEKKSLRFFDILIDGLNAQADGQIYGWAKKTYEDIHVASLTKDPKWSFQREWRVVFGPEAGSHKQPFPFVKSIFLGEKMEPQYRNMLIELAIKNGWDVFERKINKTGSKIIYSPVDVER